MRIKAFIAIPSIMIAGAAVLALTGGLRDRAAPAAADGPSTSFSVDLDPAAAGIQATRSVPLDMPFSISVWLDATDLTAFIQADVRIDYDDFKLTAPASGIPADWKDASVLDSVGGTSAPWPSVFECSPDPASNAHSGEDGVGTATLNTGCNQGVAGATTLFTGPLFEYVLECDSTGTADITIINVNGWTMIVDEAFFSYEGHAHNATVSCGSGSGDADSDGMPDVYENAHAACLNASVADAGANPDTDGKTNLEEYGLGTDPCDNDTDNDGCADGEELDNPALQGGQRNPLNGWDFYDVNATKKVDAADIGLVRSKFNQDYPPYDRSSGAATWAPGPPNGIVNAVDIGLVRASFNHSCINPP